MEILSCHCRDFNDLLSNAEKKGLCSHPMSLIHGFPKVVKYYGLTNLGIKGHPLLGSAAMGLIIRYRRDQTDSIPSLAKSTFVLNLLMSKVLDHSPIFLQLHTFHFVSIASTFKFENIWVK